MNRRLNKEMVDDMEMLNNSNNNTYRTCGSIFDMKALIEEVRLLWIELEAEKAKNGRNQKEK